MSKSNEVRVKAQCEACDKCAHRKNPQGGWCYMFETMQVGCGHWRNQSGQMLSELNAYGLDMDGHLE